MGAERGRAVKRLLIALLLLAVALPALAEQSMAEWSADLLASTKARLEVLRSDLAQAPGEAKAAYEKTRASLMTGSGVRGFTYLMILLFVGIAVEWLYWVYAYSPLRALQASPAETPLQALKLGMRRFALLGSGLVLFTLATIGTSAAFTWPAGIHQLVIAATLLLVLLRLAWLGVSVVLAPGKARLRLVPVDDSRARGVAVFALAVLALMVLGRFLPPIVERAGEAAHVAAALRFVAYTLAAAALFVGAFVFFSPRSGGGAPLFPRHFMAALLVVAVYTVWLLNERAAPIAAIVAVVLALQLGLHDIVYFYWQDDHDSALPAIVLSLARFVVVLLGIGVAVVALDAPLRTVAEEASPWVKIGLRLLSVAVLALLAHGVWLAIRSVVDHRLASIKPADPHATPDASSRLLTLLPLLRVTAAVLLLVMLILSALWALGIEITPLLAGAGVIGLALGFGAQALVRDVIAGIFYLADDAFRVGEYIESGTAIKGTVEKITLRSVALRHHNGPLHFVPYGNLGSVRNTSRDWVIDKFNVPLPIDVDSEAVRKMIKKVGEQMKEDPALGPTIMEPLKGKLYRVDPGVKIFRLKFRTAPGKQFDVRGAAFKRIEAALKKMGVGFADGKQTVLVQSSYDAPETKATAP
jgi:small-conductance mechanosensitive channel